MMIMRIAKDMRRRIVEIENRFATLKTEFAFQRLMLALKAGFDPDQPRDDQGKWTGDAKGQAEPASSGFDSALAAIIAKAKSLNLAAAGPRAIDLCIDLCYRILERPRLNSDRNEWDFRRCLNACMGR